jgi:colanic acid/amylovoran biosynthesis protein
MAKILICGAGFQNKGAEAMLRTVQAELLKRVPEVDLFLWGIPEEDCRLALDAGMNPLPLPFALQLSMWRILGGRIRRSLWSMSELCRSRNFKHCLAVFDREALFSRACRNYFQRVLPRIDAYVDISGFSYGDSWGVRAFQRIRPLIDDWREHGKPAVFLPQAWGSFENAEVKRALRGLLSDPCVLFYSRDPSSCRYLENALEKPMGTFAPCPDIVFNFRGGTREQGEQVLRNMGCSMRRRIVGIAPNMQVFERVSGKGTGNGYVQALAKLAKHCLENHDVDVVLQANKISADSAAKDDRFLCSLIAAMVNRPDRCFMTREPLCAEAAWALTGRFEFLIGSRFHSLVFGFSQGVPAMAVSWSHKYRELFSLFGMERSVQECESIDTGALISAFDRGWMERQEQKPRILARMKELRAEVDAVFDEVASAIRGDNTKRNVRYHTGNRG